MTSTTSRMSKTEWRAHFRKVSKDETSAENQARASRTLATRLKTLFGSASTQGKWAGFTPLHHEPDLTSLFNEPSSIDWVFPKVAGDALQFFRASCLNDSHWAEGSFGIREPRHDVCEPVAPSEIRGFLVPGLAFDHQGTRLGRGRGFYDRVLSEFPQSIKIGIAFDRHIADQPLPSTAYDIPMDLVVTETRQLMRDSAPDAIRRMARQLERTVS